MIKLLDKNRFVRDKKELLVCTSDLPHYQYHDEWGKATS